MEMFFLSHLAFSSSTLFTGEVISCLEDKESLQSVDLSDLSVTLDIFVLTLPLEMEVIPSDFHHNR